VVEASGPPPRGSKPLTSTFTPTSTVSLQVQLRETAPRRPSRVGEGHCACQSTAAPSYGPRAIRRASFAAALARHQSSARGRSASLGAFKRSSKHNHISRYTSTGRRLPARRWGTSSSSRTCPQAAGAATASGNLAESLARGSALPALYS
jgi:hypothetical protein